MKKEGIRIATIDSGKPWQNGTNESLNGPFRNECLDAELFGSLTEAKVVIADWRRRYNKLRPHSTYGYITPEMAYFPKRANREKLTT
ncbi:MAG: putative transposase [Granulosicoccus sp.]|jgi:putative transposase